MTTRAPAAAPAPMAMCGGDEVVGEVEPDAADAWVPAASDGAASDWAPLGSPFPPPSRPPGDGGARVVVDVPRGGAGEGRGDVRGGGDSVPQPRPPPPPLPADDVVQSDWPAQTAASWHVGHCDEHMPPAQDASGAEPPRPMHGQARAPRSTGREAAAVAGRPSAAPGP